MPKDLPDVWTDKDKASYNRYKELAEKEPGYKPASFDAISTDKEKLRDIKEKLAKEKENYTGRAPVAPVPESKYIKGTPENEALKASRYGRGSGRAAPLDLEGGMSPGQSPSLDNPLKQKKGGLIKKKYAMGGKVSTAEKRNPKNPRW